MSWKAKPRSNALVSTGGRGVAVALSATVLALTIGGAAIAAQSSGDGAQAAGGNGSPLLLGRSNGTGSNPITGQTKLFARNSDYALRESNLSDAGGGAIHGCRTQAPPPNAETPGDKPCLRANNLSTGQAFQFQTTQGNTGGRIQVGGTNLAQVNPSGVPFETNAAGKVANLNADKVDGLDAAQLQGQQGPQGPQGQQGPQGPAGPSSVREAYRTNLLALDNSFSTILSIPDLQPGSYLISASPQVLGSVAGDGGEIICRLLTTGAATRDARAEVTALPDIDGRASLALGQTATLDAPGSANLQCRATNLDLDTAAGDGNLTATRVGSATTDNQS